MTWGQRSNPGFYSNYLSQRYTPKLKWWQYIFQTEPGQRILFNFITPVLLTSATLFLTGFFSWEETVQPFIEIPDQIGIIKDQAKALGDETRFLKSMIDQFGKTLDSTKESIDKWNEVFEDHRKNGVSHNQNIPQ